MQQNATPANDATLTPAQEKALATLLAGETMKVAAEAAGVDRVTVYRWLKHDFHFAASYNGGRRELANRLRTRLENIAAKAVGVVDKQIDAGHIGIALAFLRGVGAMTGAPEPIGPDDAETLELKQLQAERDKNLTKRIVGN